MPSRLHVKILFWVSHWDVSVCWRHFWGFHWQFGGQMEFENTREPYGSVQFEYELASSHVDPFQNKHSWFSWTQILDLVQKSQKVPKSDCCFSEKRSKHLKFVLRKDPSMSNFWRVCCKGPSRSQGPSRSKSMKNLSQASQSSRTKVLKRLCQGSQYCRKGFSRLKILNLLWQMAPHNILSLKSCFSGRGQETCHGHGLQHWWSIIV